MEAPNPYRPVSIQRRVWLLDRMEELRDDLQPAQRLELLARLRAMRYEEWREWLIPHTDEAAWYAAQVVTERQRHRRAQGADGLLVHHAAMFMTGLHELARGEAFPEMYRHKSERFAFETAALAVGIRVWEDLQTQLDCALFWLFDEPACPGIWPFRDA